MPPASRRSSEPWRTATAASVTTRRARVRCREECHQGPVSEKVQRPEKSNRRVRPNAAPKSDVEQPTATEIDVHEEGSKHAQRGVKEWDIARRTAEVENRTRRAGQPRPARKAKRPPSRARQPDQTEGAAAHQPGFRQPEGQANRKSNQRHRESSGPRGTRERPHAERGGNENRPTPTTHKHQDTRKGSRPGPRKAAQNDEAVGTRGRERGGTQALGHRREPAKATHFATDASPTTSSSSATAKHSRAFTAERGVVDRP